MAAIRIVNWDRFQHYKNRNPPWLKLHRALLDNREWAALSGDASKLLAECWLLASEYDAGTIPMSTRDLAWRLRRPDESHLAGLLQELAAHGFVELVEHDASTVLAACKQVATPEAEVEREEETETDTLPNGSGGQAADEVIDAEVEIVEEDGICEPRPDEPRPALSLVRPGEWDAPPERVSTGEIIVEWLKRQPIRPPDKVIAKQGAAAKRLAEACTREEMRRAFVGMETLFPYSKGDPWDLFKLEQRLAEALAGAMNHPRLKAARFDAELDAALDKLGLAS